MFFGFRNINNQNSWFSVFVVIVVLILQIYLYCAAIPDQIIQVRVLKYDSLYTLPYGICHRIFKNRWYSEVGRDMPRPFLGLRNFRKNFKFSIFVFWPQMVGNVLKPTLQQEFYQKIKFERFPRIPGKSIFVFVFWPKMVKNM